MPAQTLDAFLRSLGKGAPATAYYFHGPEDLLKDEALRALLDRVLDPSLRDFNLDQRSAGQLDADTLFALCTTLPMMAERRVVVLREIEALKRKPKVRGGAAGVSRPAGAGDGAGADPGRQRGERGQGDRSRRGGDRLRAACPRTARSSGSSAGPRVWASRCPRTRRDTWCARWAASSPPLAAELDKLAALPAGRAAHRRAGRRAGRGAARGDDLRLARRGDGGSGRPRQCI